MSAPVIGEENKLSWRRHESHDLCDWTVRSDGIFYQIGKNPPEVPGDPWYAARSRLRERKEFVVMGQFPDKHAARHCCEADWRKVLAAGGVQRVAVALPGEVNNYALEPFEPSGDEEWDRRARGAVETDGL